MQNQAARRQAARRQTAQQQTAQQPNQRIDLKRFGDWTSWSSWLILLGMLPFSALSIAGFAWLPALLMPGGFLRNLTVLVAAYFALLPVVFIPGMNWLQIKLIAPDSRPLTGEERSRLRPAWQALLSRVGKGGNRRYQLRVIDSDNLNAYAGGGRLVIITSLALRALAQPELEAVLSHELGHHAGMHPIVVLANSWLTRPIVWFHSLLRLVHDLLITVINHTPDGWIRIILLVVLLVPRAVLGALSLVWRVATLLLLFFGRHAEHQADATAVKLGYGHDLISALNTLQDAVASQNGFGRAHVSGTHEAGTYETGTHETEAGLKEVRMVVVKNRWDTHPPTSKRLQKITRALATSK